MSLTQNVNQNSFLILGHTRTGMGERVLAYKMEKLIKEAGFSTFPTIDLIDLMGELYEPYGWLNYDLADGGYSPIEGLTSLSLPKAQIALVLSWCFGLAALFATDLCHSHYVVAKLYAHHPNERILPKLYAPAHLLITESLLANERGETYGLDQGKMLYLPHCYVTDDKVEKSNFEIRKSKKRLIGTVARLEYGKNCEFAIEAVRRLVEKGEDVLLYLKGDFCEKSPYPAYKGFMKKILEVYQEEEWLIWDSSYTPFPDVLALYRQFDLLLHPSGAEGGSHVVVEALGLGIPCIVLNCSTHPYLFKDLVTFVNTTGKMYGHQPAFCIPDLEDLVNKLSQDLSPPDLARVSERFDPAIARERIPLLFDPNPDKIKNLYQKDCKLYGL
ncbi:MAG: glycosyltransferase family 4 protein [Chlamydiales bacterium]